MNNSFSLNRSGSEPTAPVYNISPNYIDPVQLARSLRQANAELRPQLMIDCRQLKCLRTHGVSHLVSQLLLTQQAGAEVVLYNVDAGLSRVLRLLQLHHVFRMLPAAPVA